MKTILTILLLIIGMYSSHIQAQKRNNDSPYLQKERYIPAPYSDQNITKTLHVAIHIWQRADGSGNFQNTPETKERFNQIITWVNQVYNRPQYEATPALPYPVQKIDQGNIFVKLEGVYFYQDASLDSSYCYTTKYAHNQKLNQFLEKNYPKRTKTLNIHVFRGKFYASGYSLGGSIGTFYIESPDMATSTKGDWWLSRHWAHEIGHGFDLWHTYDRNPGYQQNCNPNYQDFLYDVFDTTQVQNDPNCSIKMLQKTETNNLMGGANNARTLSALQMGIINRATVVENVRNTNYNMRDYITGYSFHSLKISQDETWDVSMKIYQNVVVKSGSKLIIQKEIQMVPQAKIIVEPGAELIIDGGKITYENYYQKKWKGVYLKKASKRSGLKNGTLNYQNGGEILHAKRIK